MQILAIIISIIFNPFIMPPVGLLILFNSGTYLDFLSFPQKRAIFIILITGTTILPLIIFPFMRLQRMISDIRLADHRERFLPLLITFVFYSFTWYMLSRMNAPGLVSTYTITASLAILICALISLKYKISLHMTALGALAGMLLAVAFRFNINLHLWLSLAFLAGGLTGWARLKLKAHKPSEVYLGYLSGVALAFFMLYNY